MLKLLWWTLPFSVIFLCSLTNVLAISEDEMESLLATYNQDSVELCRRSALSGWDVATDVGNQTKENEQVHIHFISYQYSIEPVFTFFLL